MQRDRVAEPLPPDYNVAPTKPVYAVMTRQARDERPEAGDRAGLGGGGSGNAGPGGGGSGSAGKGGGGSGNAGPGGGESGSAGKGGVERELRVVRWGLVPSWAKDISIGSRMINARAETVSEKPAYRTAFARRRCLLPADGYYEWQQPPAGTRGPKQPYFICRPDHGPLAFAGLYELWRDRALPRDAPDAWIWTAAIITTSAPDELGEIHDRMPMVIDPASWADWLDPVNTEASDVRVLLTPAAASGLTTYPVSLAVNSVRNNGPELIIAADPVSYADADLTGGARPGGAGTRAAKSGAGKLGVGTSGAGKLEAGRLEAGKTGTARSTAAKTEAAETGGRTYGYGT